MGTLTAEKRARQRQRSLPYHPARTRAGWGGMGSQLSLELTGGECPPHRPRRKPGQLRKNESLLHHTAKSLIRTGIEHALASGCPYYAAVLCRCGQRHTLDLAAPGATVSAEDRRAAKGARPDLLIESVEGRVVGIEIVVTHAPTPAASRACAAQRIAIIEVTPTWPSLTALENGLVGTTNTCPRFLFAAPIADGEPS